MRESRTYGSVRGAPSNGRPYRNREIGLGYEALSFICRHKSPSGPLRAPIPRGEPRPGPMSAGLRRKAVCGSGCAETAKALGLTIPPAILAMAD